MSKKDYQKNGKSAVAAVSIGAVISIVLMLIGTMIIALLVMNETMTEKAIGYGVLAVTLIATFTGAYVALTIYKKKYLITSMSVSIVFALILLSLTALFFDGQFNGVPATLLVIICGGVSAMLVAGKGRHRTKQHRKKLKL